MVPEILRVHGQAHCGRLLDRPAATLGEQCESGVVAKLDRAAKEGLINVGGQHVADHVGPVQGVGPTIDGDVAASHVLGRAGQQLPGQRAGTGQQSQPVLRVVVGQFEPGHRVHVVAQERLHAFLDRVVCEHHVAIHGDEDVRVRVSGEACGLRVFLAAVALPGPDQPGSEHRIGLPVIADLLVVHLGAVVHHVDNVGQPGLVGKREQH